MIKKQKKSSDEAALPRTEGGAATDPTPEPVQSKPVREPVPPPAPKEEVPESVPDKVEAPPPAVVDDGKPKVPFKVFAVSCGIKWDQMAGFKSHAKRMKLGPLSILEWREALADFQKRPVG